MGEDAGQKKKESRALVIAGFGDSMCACVNHRDDASGQRGL